MREANRISSIAHISLMKNAVLGMNECELEALFTYETQRRGCRHQAYGCICGGGTNSSVLHYVNNDKVTQSNFNREHSQMREALNCRSAKYIRILYRAFAQTHSTHSQMLRASANLRIND